MGRKIVNLDDKQNTAEITLGGYTWEISRVVIRLREMYGEYVKHAGEYLEVFADLREAEDTEQLEKMAEQYAYEKAEKLDAMMEKLLTKNGYEYDKEWWAEHVGDYQAMEQFIVACLNKDQEDSESGGKKKAAESSISTE